MIKSAVDLPLAKALKQVPKAKRVPFRVGNPKVANLIANAAIKNALDLPAAVAELKPDFTPSQVANVAEELERSPQVQAAIQQGLQKRGLDGQSRERFVEILWKYAEDADAANEKRTLAAWRILGRGFIGDKIEQTVIEPLRIEGWEEGVRRMLADAPDPDDSNSQSLGERNAGLG